ncbi:hypothetical protein CR513_20944, partial [Mucuna pruriens]
MAKKKVSQPSQSHYDLKQSQTMPMANLTDDPSVQIQNLKRLNAVLVTETTQRRQQIESLQSELHRSVLASDTALAIHMENAVVSAFVENQVKEMNLRFDALLGEREHEVAVLKRELNDVAARLLSETTALSGERDELVHEAKRLEENLNRERKLREEAERLRFDSEELLSEKQRVILEQKMDRDSALKSSQESVMVIETLKEEIEAVTREKNEVEDLNNGREKKIVALELEVKELNECWKKEEEFMRAKILQLEGNLAVALQKEEEISFLLKEKKEMEKRVEILTVEKDGVRNALDVVQKELEVRQHELDEATRVKGEIEVVKGNLESEIVELQSKVDELLECCRKCKEENKQFVLQVESFRNAVDEVVLEKDDIKKGFDEEKKKVEKLQLLIAGAQEGAMRSDAELGELRSQRDKLVKKESMLECRVSALRKENDALQSMITEVQSESRDLSAKIEFWCNNSDKALAMLKATAAALVGEPMDRGEEVVSDENLVEEIQPYAQELNAIKKAFKNKEEMVDDMKQQLLSLNMSVVEAHKTRISGFHLHCIRLIHGE